MDIHSSKSFCEELIDIGEGFKVQRITCRIEKKHRGLFAHLASEADVWLDDEVNACFAKSVGKCLPLIHRKNNAEVWNRDVVAVYGIVMVAATTRTGLQVRDDLMAEEVEVDPLRGASAF